MAQLLNQMRSALMMLVVLSVITGLIYPALVTGIAQLLFPIQANGSLINLDGQLKGSTLIGQSFSGAQYFWSRPSATTPYPYNSVNSSGSNLGPSNPDYLKTVKDRVEDLQKNHDTKSTVPVDLVTSSASGLDPEISPFAALYQVQRIAATRNISQQALLNLITQHTQQRTFAFLGEPRVNVLELNLALDKISTVGVK